MTIPVPSWVVRRERIVFAGLLLLHATFLWVFTYLPTQDGPSHLSNAHVMVKYFHPEYPLFREYYVLNTGVWSNWLGHGVLAGLMSFFPLLVAERVFVSGYVIGLPLAVRYALTGIRPEAGVVSLLAFPLIYNFNFQMGFWSFCFSLAIFFLMLGFWMRHRDGIGLGAWAVLAALGLVLCLLHVLSFVMACLFIGVLSLAEMLARPRRLSPRKTFRFWTLPTAMALGPGLLVAVVFVRGQGMDPLGIPGGGNPLFFPMYLLTKLMSLASFRGWEAAIYGGFGVWLVGMAILVPRRGSAIPGRNGFLVLILVCVVVLYVAPEKMSGGSFIPTRLILFWLASLLFWLGLHIRSEGRGDDQGTAMVIVSVAVSLALLIAYGALYRELNEDLKEYVSGARHIEANTTVLPICLAPQGCARDRLNQTYGRTRPLIHAAGYIAAGRPVVEFSNYEAHRGHFPILFRPGREPYLQIGPLESLHKPLDFLTYTARTGGRVDYVLTWGEAERADYPREVVESIAEQIREGYELIFASERGRLMLYRRRGWPGRDR